MTRHVTQKAVDGCSDEEAEYICRMVVRLREAVLAEVHRDRIPSYRRQPVKDRIGPSPVYQELERLLGMKGSA